MLSILPLLIDILLLALLFVALFFGLRLSRQFSVIKSDQARLGELVKQLDVASQKAEVAVKNMKKNALEASEALQAQNGKAQAMSEELEIMIEAGNSLAERLQKIAEHSRRIVQSGQNASAAPLPDNKNTDSKNSKGRTRAEQELHAAISDKRNKT